jgi:hypothetical protein
MNQIQITINTPGWEEITEIFNKEILNCTDVKNIKKNLSAENYKIEGVARSQAAKTLLRVLKRVNNQGIIAKEKKVYI